jgi:uncharacterized protein (DUF1697 family)
MHYVALLRGINLGKRRIKMEDLRALFEALKFRHVATFIASGNVIFESATADTRKLENQIERHLEKSLGYSVDTFVRTRAEIAAVAVAQPFRKPDMASETNTVHVGFWKEGLDAERARKLASIRTDADEFHVDGREFYWLCRIKTHESKVWTLPELRALRLPTGTMRNLKAIRRLTAEHPPPNGPR